jgi:transglutaminase-like putative cysteine protease
MEAQRNPFVTIARASLTFAAAVGLARVFRGGSWLGPITVAAVLPPAIAAFTQYRRWHPLTGIGITVILGALLAVFVNDPSGTIAGIPTGTGLSNFVHDIGRAPHVLRTAVVPVPPHGAALLLAFVATYVAASVTDVVARRLEAPIGAIGPSVALFVAVCALGADSWVASTACYALAVVTYLVALQSAEVSARRTWFQSSRPRRSQAMTGGIAAGALVVMLAVALGPEFPGAKGAAWINYKRLGVGNGSSVLNADSPFLNIGDKLNIDAEREVFTVRTSDDQPYRWRAIALDEYDEGEGEGWGLDAKQGSTKALKGPSEAPGAVRVTQTFDITRTSDAHWLPAAFRAVEFDFKEAASLPESATIFLPKANGPVADVTYEVESEIWSPPVDQLRSVTFDDLRKEDENAFLPDNIPASVLEEAREITADATTPYDTALALENYFQSDLFTYDQSVDYNGSKRALQTFVLDERRGFCQQFAAAFGIMARSLGLPTRVAVGYQPGEKRADGTFLVKGKDAHAWPEVYFGEEFGWQPFEPTKGYFDATSQRGAQGANSTTPTTGNTTPTSAGTPTTVGSNPPTSARAQQDPTVKVDPKAKTGTPTSTADRVVIGVVSTLALVLVGVGALLAALILAARRRTQRRRTAPDARRRVLGAWAEALERLAAAGVTPRPSATSLEFALRHAPAHGAGGAGPPLMDLARLQSAALFAEEAPSAADADEAWARVDQIDDALKETVSRSERWITRLRIRKRDRRVTEPV